METIANLLPALACPIGMGLVRWLVMRGQGRQPSQMPAAPPAVADGLGGGSLLDALRCCFNWRVYAGLAMVGVGG